VSWVRLAKLWLVAVAIAAPIAIARPATMDGALNACQHLAAKVATLH
jgi:hypothetical protein